MYLFCTRSVQVTHTKNNVPYEGMGVSNLRQKRLVIPKAGI